MTGASSTACTTAGRLDERCFSTARRGMRWLSRQLIDAAQSAGFELLVIDRPGYGRTSRWPGRRIVDVVDDVRAVLESVGWERLASGVRGAACVVIARLPHQGPPARAS